ncbi:hypothetical protein [Cognatilysobacter terrigena]|uniref:hypothetical protein n=1 Tax=Cognatilysobacter terrigena TaxID=2488749 RepID=UPI00105E6285|nr:hypothetical protein [Lysobacter terrigena]
MHDANSSDLPVVTAANGQHFRNHTFGAYCYDTRSCSVTYGGMEHVVPSERAATHSFNGESDIKHWEANAIVDKTFAGPAVVRWTSKDGTPLEATLDLDRIFPGHVVLHRVPADQIPPNAVMGDPGIIVVVDDRTVAVYMKAFVPTRDPQIPGNPHSSFRADPVRAWSHTY